MNEPKHDEVWQDADGMVIARAFDGWLAFGYRGELGLDSHLITYPLTKLLNEDGTRAESGVTYSGMVEAEVEPDPKPTLLQLLETVASANNGNLPPRIAHVIFAEHLHRMYYPELRDLFDDVYNHDVVEHEELRARLRRHLLGSTSLHLDTLENAGKRVIAGVDTPAF